MNLLRESTEEMLPKLFLWERSAASKANHQRWIQNRIFKIWYPTQLNKNKDWKRQECEDQFQVISISLIWTAQGQRGGSVGKGLETSSHQGVWGRQPGFDLGPNKEEENQGLPGICWCPHMCPQPYDVLEHAPVCTHTQIHNKNVRKKIMSFYIPKANTELRQFVD